MDSTDKPSLSEKQTRRKALEAERARKNALEVIGQPFDTFDRFDGHWIPEQLACQNSLSLGAKHVWGRLARFGGQTGIFPSISTLAAEIGISRRQCHTYIRELEARGLIRTIEQLGRVNSYAFLWHQFFTEITPMQKAAQVRKAARVGVQKAASQPVQKAASEGRLKSVMLREV